MNSQDPVEEHRLFEIALRVTDGLPVDWGLERTGVPDADASFESLALIAEIGAEHRSTDVVAGRLDFSELLGRSVDWMRRLSRIRHPNLVAVQKVEVRDGCLGIRSEELRGRSLEDDLRSRGPMGAREAALVGIDVCSALEAMHSRGLAHGAIDTRCIFREGVPGALRNAGRIVVVPIPPPSAERDSSLAASRHPPIATDDVRAVGALLYRILTGRDPADPSSPGRDSTSGEAGGLRSIRPDLPFALVRAIEKALDPEPAHRHRDATAMQNALFQVLGVEGRVTRRARLPRWRLSWMLAGTTIVALAVVAILGRSELRRFGRPLASAPVVTTPLRLQVIGSEPKAWFGYYSGSNAGDSNGDGSPDLLWGAPLTEDERGRAYVLFGGRNADASPDLVLRGSAPEELFGNSVAGLGDVNGDHWDDFAVAASSDDALQPDAGRVEVHFGGPLLDTRPDVNLRGRWPAGGFGSWIAGTGDVNGDGLCDLLVGAPGDGAVGPRTGRAFLFFGATAMDSLPDLELTTYTSGSYFGQVVAGVGDVNGDGHRDFACGSSIDGSDGVQAGRAYVYFGGPALDARADLTLSGNAAGEGLMKVAGLGDVNGDGFEDLAAGAEFGAGHEPGSGRVYVYFGGPKLDATADAVLLGEHAGDLFGCWVMGAGDVNRDGFCDVMIGARRNDANGRNSGAAYICFGGRAMDAGWDLRFVGEAEYAEMGSACGPIGDFFADGFPDFFISSHGSNAGGRAAGRIDLYDVCRYAILAASTSEPSLGAPRLELRWTGREPADVSVSVDHRRTWSRRARHAGGSAENRVSIDLPASTSESLFVRLVPSDASVPGSVEAAFPSPSR